MKVAIYDRPCVVAHVRSHNVCPDHSGVEMPFGYRHLQCGRDARKYNPTAYLFRWSASSHPTADSIESRSGTDIILLRQRAFVLERYRQYVRRALDEGYSHLYCIRCHGGHSLGAAGAAGRPAFRQAHRLASADDEDRHDPIEDRTDGLYRRGGSGARQHRHLARQGQEGNRNRRRHRRQGRPHQAWTVMERERTIEKLGLKSVLLLSGPEGPRSEDHEARLSDRYDAAARKRAGGLL